MLSPEKIRLLADWFDSQEPLHPDWSGSREVQQDLRQHAQDLDSLNAKLADLRELFRLAEAWAQSRTAESINSLLDHVYWMRETK